MHHWARVGPFTFTHKSYAPTFAQESHCHERSGVDFNIRGGGRGIYRSEERISTSGQIEYFAQEAPHTFACGPRGIRTLHVMFVGETLDRPDVRSRVLATDEPEACDEAAAAGRAIAIFQELTQPDASSPLAIEALAWNLLGDVIRWPAQDGAKWIGRSVEILRACVDRPVGLSELASTLGVHRAHLARTFQATFGCSPGEYHRRMRAAEAVKRLCRSDEPVSRVAASLGFADQAHLTRVLKRCVGITPAAMRRAMHRAETFPGG